jgi:hypothetical protein
LTLAAASSIASGSPSNFRQILATVGPFTAVSSKAGAAARARWQKSSTAGDCARAFADAGDATSGSDSGGTGNWCSPPRCSGARLVASTVSSGQAPMRSATTEAPDTRCSKLSSKSSICLSRRCRFKASCSVLSATPLIPSASARTEVIRSGSLRGARGTKATPSANDSPERPATSKARRVLPTPPGPSRVTRRTSSRRRRRAAATASFSRPTNGVGGAGRVRRESSAVVLRPEERRTAASKEARSSPPRSRASASFCTVYLWGRRLSPRSSRLMA